MGMCLAFNLTVEELRNGLKNARYLVYSPAVESAGSSERQNFFAFLSTKEISGPTLTAALQKELNLQDFAEPHARTPYFQVSPLSKLTLYDDTDESGDGTGRVLAIKVFPIDTQGGVTFEHLKDVLRVDEALAKIAAQPTEFIKHEDVVYGERNILKNYLDKTKMQRGALFKPLQSQWFVGRSQAEAVAKSEESFSRRSKK